MLVLTIDFIQHLSIIFSFILDDELDLRTLIIPPTIIVFVYAIFILI